MDNIVAIARRVRKWTEEKAAKRNNKDLNGWCAIASAQLLRELKNAGIDAEIHVFESHMYCHAYVVVDDYVVDVTATQFKPFKNRPVVILHHKEAEQHEFYNSTQVFYYPSKLRDYQLKNGWPKDQVAVTR